MNARFSIKPARLSVDNVPCDDQLYGATGGVDNPKTGDFSPQSLDSTETGTENAQQASTLGSVDDGLETKFVDNNAGSLELYGATGGVDTPARDTVPTSGAEYQFPVPRAPQYTTSGSETSPGLTAPPDNGFVDSAPSGDVRHATATATA